MSAHMDLRYLWFPCSTGRTLWGVPLTTWPQGRPRTLLFSPYISFLFDSKSGIYWETAAGGSAHDDLRAEKKYERICLVNRGPEIWVEQFKALYIIFGGGLKTKLWAGEGYFQGCVCSLEEWILPLWLRSQSLAVVGEGSEGCGAEHTWDEDLCNHDNRNTAAHMCTQRIWVNIIDIYLQWARF